MRELEGEISPLDARMMRPELPSNSLHPLLLSFSRNTYQGTKPGVLGDGEEDAVAVVHDGHVRGDAIDFLQVDLVGRRVGGRMEGQDKKRD